MELTDDIKPIYLGYDKDRKTYYFYFIKEGVPRFLVYVTYFYWGLGPQTPLSLEPVPSEVELELEQFLSGDLHYEFVKARRNSKAETVRKIFRTPQQVPQRGFLEAGDRTDNKPGGRVLDGAATSSRGSSTRKSVPVAKQTQTVGVVEADTKPKRKRRTKAEMQELKKLEVKPTVENTKPKLKPVPPPKVVQVKQKRKRRTKEEMLELKKLQKTVVDVQKPKVEVKHVGRKKRSSKV